MKRWLALLLMMVPLAVAAQDERGFFGRIFGGADDTEEEEDGGSFLERQIEGALSGAGRDVTITGFSGALSSRATMEEMTIADDEGVWLTLRDVVLDWNRSALLRRRIQVNELSAAEILVPRLPAQEPSGVNVPAPEAQGFSLPELPVSVDIGLIDAERVELGEPLFGEEAVVTLNGEISLAGGAGSADISAERIDGEEGSLALEASYENESQELALDLNLVEGEDGIIANLIDLPGRPSLELSAAGAGPLTDFQAEIGLATDGQERLAGTVALGESDAGGLTFAAQIGGDVAPVFVPQYRDFFGPDVALVVAGSTLPGGGVRIDSLRLNAEALRLDGQVAVGPDGLPDRVDVSGRIAHGDGSPVLLPISGPPTRVGEVTLEVELDESVSEDWALEMIVSGLDREGFDAERVAIEGSGRISAEPPRSVTADVEFGATDLSLADGGAQAALGQEVTGTASLAWSEGEPLVLDLLTIDGETYGLEGSGQVEFGGALTVEGRAAVSARDLSAFSGIAQRPLDGAVEVMIAGSGDPLAGQFDLAVDGTTQGLQIGVPQLDPLLAGTGTLTLRTDRSETGTRIETLRIETPELTADGNGVLATGSSRVDLTASVADTSLIAASLTGPAELVASVQEVTTGYVFDIDANASGAEVAAGGVVEWLDIDPVVTADFTANVEDLGAFSDLAGRPLSGGFTGTGEARTSFDLSRGSVDATIEGDGLAIGDPRIDPLLDGDVDIDLDVERSGDVLAIRSLRLSAPDAEVTGEGRIDGLTVAPVFDGEIAVASPDLSPFSALAGRELGGAVDAEVSGTLAFDLSRFDLAVQAAADDLDPGLPGAAAALDGRTTLSLEAARDGDRVEVGSLDLSNPQLQASGSGVVTGLATAPAFDGRVAVDAADLAVFSGLAGRDLAGALDAGFEGVVASDLSEVDATLTARGQNLDLGLPGEPIFPGEVALDIAAVRENDTVRLTELSLDSANLNVDGGGQVTSLDTTPVFDGELSLSADTITPFGGLVGRDLAGSVRADVAGTVATDLSTFDVAAGAEAQGLRIGQADADRLLTGTTTLDIDATRVDSVTTIRDASLDASGFDLNASGMLGEAGAEVELSARLDDIGPYAPDFSGPVTVDGTVAQSNGTISLDIDAGGPGGIQAAVAGTVEPTGPTLDLTIDGAAPLAAVNRFVQPRTLAGTVSFDLAMQGPPGLNAISGTVSTANARFVEPTFNIVLNDIDATTSLDAGTINIDANAAVQAGGSVGVGGSVTLGGNLPANIEVALNNVVLQDPELYETSISGNVDVTGTLRGGGGRISGNIALGETEVRVPSTTSGGGGPIPEITHLNEPAAVRATRARAGLLRQTMDGTESLQERQRNAFALDLGIVAENRIFVRGRGLDAELGGSLRIGGTTVNIVPSGQFELIRGRLDILGQRLQLGEGSIRLQGDFVPYIRLVAETETDDVTALVVLSGQVNEPDIEFLSEPELPEDEVLARLLFGRGIDDISPLQAAQLASAVATLAGRGPGIGDELRRNFGLDDLDLTTNEDGAAAVRAGKYLTENIYTDVTVDTEGETQINLNFELTDSFTAKAGVNNDGDSSLGIFFERDY